jgi:(2Fe-2S) ferredoxin
MIKINNINFCEKSIEIVEVIGDDIKEIKCEFMDNRFRLTIIKDNDEVVEEVFEEEVIEEPVVEEPVYKTLTIDDVKNIIDEHIPKKNTRETYFRTIKQVHDNFGEDDIHKLLQKKMKLLDLLKPNMTS